MSRNATLALVCLVSLMSSAVVARLVAEATLDRAPRKPLEPFALPEPVELPTWRGEHSGHAVRLAPLRRDPQLQAYDAQSFGQLGLGPGEPFRLELVSSPRDNEELFVGHPRVVDAQGEACVLAAADDLPAPWSGRFSSPETALAPDQLLTVWLWGRAPTSDARLVLDQPDAASLEIPLAREVVSAGEISELSALRAAPSSLDR